MSVFVLDTIRVLLYTIEPQHKDQKKNGRDWRKKPTQKKELQNRGQTI